MFLIAVLLAVVKNGREGNINSPPSLSQTEKFLFTIEKEFISALETTRE